MSNTKAGMRILAASANIQHSVAGILEAKADEMESLRDWLLHYLQYTEFGDAQQLVSQTCEFHEHLLEALVGITKIEQGLALHLEELLAEEEGAGGALDDWMGGPAHP